MRVEGAAGELWLGARVKKADGGYGIVKAISVVHKPQVMYNLTVEAAHTYHVGDEQWLVHNNCHPLHDRAQELHNLLDPFPQSRTTTATARGRMPTLFGEEEWVFVASSERRLPRVQQDALTDGEYPVRGDGHAEETIINFIRAVGGELDEIAASRPICRHTCLPLIQQDGIRPVSPIKR